MTLVPLKPLALALALALAAPAAAQAGPRPFATKLHAALAQDGVSSDEIDDGTITCDDLAPDVGVPGCQDPDSVEARNVFVDGFSQTNREMPSTPSANVPEASIAKLEVGDGSQVILASIVWSANPVGFTGGIVTCHLVPPNGPNSKAEFIQTGAGSVTTGTLFVTTTNSGAGTVDFRCSDQDPGHSVQYRFLQLTAIPVASLTRAKLL